MAQAGVLLAGSPVRRLQEQVPVACEALGVPASEGKTLGEAAVLYWQVQAAIRLIYWASLPGEIGTGAAAFLLRETGHASLQDLEESLAETAARVAAIVDDQVGGA